jgi:hypothetical protein
MKTIILSVCVEGEIRRKFIYNFIQKERDHWEDQDVGGWTILKWILER